MSNNRWNCSRVELTTRREARRRCRNSNESRFSARRGTKSFPPWSRPGKGSLSLSRGEGAGGGGPVRPFGKAGCTEDDQRCTRLRRFTIYDRRNDFYLLQGKKQKTIFFPVFPFYFLRKIRAIARSCTWQKFWNNP